ncbi:MAG: hypothetical protein AAFX52_03200 [Pseudomonadota bacterium]
MRDRPATLAVIFAGAATALLTQSNWFSDLTAMRLASLGDQSAPIASDLPLVIASVLALDPMVALRLTSIIGWVSGAVLLILFSTTRRDAVLMLHPAALVMTAVGAGFGAFGLITLFGAIRRTALSRAMVDLPMVGLAMAFATLTVPEFERLLLPLASVLFLIAPPAMLERQMLSFYLIVFLPALTVLGLSVGLGRDLVAPSAPANIEPTVAIAAIAAPGLLWTGIAKPTRRLALVFLFLFTVMSFTDRDGLDWPVLTAALASASALRGRFGVFPEALGAIATLGVMGLLADGMLDLRGLTSAGSPS